MEMQDRLYNEDAFRILPDIPDASVDLVLSDPPYPNRMPVFQDTLTDGIAGIYLSCKKAKNYVAFFWSPFGVPQPPAGFYEVARHVWHKPDGRSPTSYELVVVWSRENRRKRSKVWSIPIIDYRSLRDFSPHPTQKPVRLVRYLLDLYTRPGDIVLDPFLGSGTTAIACKQLGRHYIGIEKDERYYEIARKRVDEASIFRRESEQLTAQHTADVEPDLPDEPPVAGDEEGMPVDDVPEPLPDLPEEEARDLDEPPQIAPLAPRPRRAPRRTDKRYLD